MMKPTETVNQFQVSGKKSKNFKFLEKIAKVSKFLKKIANISRLWLVFCFFWSNFKKYGYV